MLCICTKLELCIIVSHLSNTLVSFGVCFAYTPFQVPLGVLLLNENKLDDMAKILSHYNKLVPKVEAKGQIQLSNGGLVELDATKFFPILFGGDQLTIAHIRGIQMLRDTQDNRCDQFEGILPVVEDWHSRMTLMKVC